MREGDQLGAAEGTGATLDRMDRPEGGVDILGIRRAFVQRLQAHLEGPQELFALLEESLFEFRQRIHGRKPQFW
ncbi:hypothetical protein BSY19_3600 [Bosea sp. RAC05]|nr:hypothetical protein [Bosea sp. RAC05]AOG07139.1 hypothetical protein BSY19_3600 [Bosea sp. RAC05]